MTDKLFLNYFFITSIIDFINNKYRYIYMIIIKFNLYFFHMKKSPEVSIIITTYNRKSFLKKAVNSILNQSYKNFELIVVDNYSGYNFLN